MKTRKRKSRNQHMKLLNNTIIVGNNFYHIKPKWSFVHSVSEEYSEPKEVGHFFIGPKFIKGIGMFRCKQTGDLREMPYLDHVKQPYVMRF
ncbi:hypothetical protein KAR91_46500 [Candidatus Pacearchaeota archaeon]|nr:hypothetical protein [Candidatus Pacearchaeota archaeon]